MKLDKHSSVPLYAQLKELLLERIHNQEYAPGTRIPSELSLCEELELSRPTVRQAVAELVSEGSLTIIKGKGTYVTAEPERVELQRFNAFTCSFLMMKNLDDLGIRKISRKSASEETNRMFGQQGSQSGSDIWQIEWALKSGADLIGWCQSLIPTAMFPELAKDLENQKQMLDIVANKYAYLPQKGNLSMQVRAANDSEARLLDISRRSPVLAFTSVLNSRSGHVCEVIRLIIRPELASINFESSRL